MALEVSRIVFVLRTVARAARVPDAEPRADASISAPVPDGLAGLRCGGAAIGAATRRSADRATDSGHKMARAPGFWHEGVMSSMSARWITVLTTATLGITASPHLASAAPEDPPEESTPAQAPSEPAPAARSLAIGGLAGFGVGDFTTFKLHGEGQYTLLPLAPKMSLAIAGHVGLDLKDSYLGLEFVPKGRVLYTLDDKLAFYGDVGFGLAIIHVSAGNLSETDLAGLLRFAGGAEFKLTEGIYLVGEPVGLNLYFKSGSAFQYSILVGALFKL
jgi:hypothetical protein